MELNIRSTYKKIDENFVLYLCLCLKRLILSNVDTKQLCRYNEHLKALNIPYRAENVVVQGANSITYLKCGENYKIHIDENAKIDGGSYKISSLCKLINNGAIGVSPYPIFTKSIEELVRDIDTYNAAYALKL